MNMLDAGTRDEFQAGADGPAERMVSLPHAPDAPSPGDVQPRRSIADALDAGGPDPARFASVRERTETCARLAREGVVMVELEPIASSVRGRLGDVIDEAIERALTARGAAPPGILATSDRDASLSDQLFRARRAGATGIALVLGPLHAALGPSAALEPEDCVVLRFLAQASAERPIVLLLDASDEKTAGYDQPLPLRDLLSSRPKARATQPAARTGVERFARHNERSAGTVASNGVPPAPTAVVGSTPAQPWREWTLKLSAARGPQPLATLERLFGESYMPLHNAIATGLDDARAQHAHDEFAATFARGYTEAFSMFAATTKRPRMVLDAHDLAGRIARLHGARSTRLLLVDGMRWDVSRVIEEHLVAALGARASLTEELLLWSALPTTTMRQLETIARGVEALRSPAALEPESEPPRGRTAEYVRRMRIGPRELLKLDLLEARIQAARGHVLRDLPEIAHATAQAVARHVETLPPRTLVFVFGDHGFTVDRGGVARQGGASPEEVLVGAFALLVGEMH
jgi:hypothetical protein